MDTQNQNKDLLEQLKNNPPKIIGGYKKPGWALKVLDKISNDSVEHEPDGSTVTAKAILEAKDETYYPAFITLDMTNKGQIAGAYFISESDEEFELLPFEIAKAFIKKEEAELTPFKYRTLEQIEGDEIQVNWPDFT
ncbi:hypothetical protein JOC77_000259 [Peribacillus deserti]|uniref:Uncharacterized protein n=1 Tax=Peribacillus deserti TaxID=673318 RepID=A0ABS2QCH5_9BACI|nr:hypothetical protein [Peribacillus deserti]MBM7690856.1 hypothetical protein [Peribacillus deserti]